MSARQQVAQVRVAFPVCTQENERRFVYGGSCAKDSMKTAFAAGAGVLHRSGERVPISQSQRVLTMPRGYAR